MLQESAYGLARTPKDFRGMALKTRSVSKEKCDLCDDPKGTSLGQAIRHSD